MYARMSNQSGVCLSRWGMFIEVVVGITGAVITLCDAGGGVLVCRRCRGATGGGEHHWRRPQCRCFGARRRHPRGLDGRDEGHHLGVGGRGRAPLGRHLGIDQRLVGIGKSRARSRRCLARG